MKPIGNVVGHLDLSKPVTQEQIIRALKDSRKGPALRDAFKAGYHIDPLRPTAIAATCGALMGRRITVIPRLVRD